MSSNSPISDLSLDNSEDDCRITHESLVQTNSNCVQRDDNTNDGEEKFIEEISNYQEFNDCPKSSQKSSRKSRKRKHSSEATENVFESKPSNDSNRSTPDTKVRTKFDPQRRLKKLSENRIKDHYLLVDDEEPETKLKCMVCTMAVMSNEKLKKNKWTIASNNNHSIVKHLDSNIHKKSVQQFIVNQNVQNLEMINNSDFKSIYSESLDLDDIDFDIDTNFDEIEAEFKSELFDLYNIWSIKEQNCPSTDRNTQTFQSENMFKK